MSVSDSWGLWLFRVAKVRGSLPGLTAQMFEASEQANCAGVRQQAKRNKRRTELDAPERGTLVGTKYV